MSTVVKKANFTYEETKALFELYGQRHILSKFVSNRKCHTHIWEMIAAGMAKKGYDRTPQQCKDRLENQKRKYFSLRRAYQPGDPVPTWEFWEQFERITKLRSNEVIEKDDALDALTEFDDTHSAEWVFLPQDISRESPAPEIKQEVNDEESNPWTEFTQTASKTYEAQLSPTPSKKQKVEVQTSMSILELLNHSKEREELLQRKLEKRDSEFLAVLNRIGAAVERIADSLAGPATREDELPVQCVYNL